MLAYSFVSVFIEYCSNAVRKEKSERFSKMGAVEDHEDSF